MTIHEGLSQLKQARASLSGQSVLNPEITAVDAWELLWREMVKLYGEHDPMTRLAPWLEKRVRQICTNRLNPALPDLVGPPAGENWLAEKFPKPREAPPGEEQPKKRNPFERKFS